VQVLVVNAGSSSLKLRLLDEDDSVVGSADLPCPVPADMATVLESFVEKNPDFDATGHRVVHGGAAFRQPIVLNDRIDARLDVLGDLAPLHNPPSLSAIHGMRSLRPDLPQVACFDTSFHADMPAKATTYAVPRSWREQWGIRRFGFHGLSHAWASRRAGDILGRPHQDLRLVTAHLGAGASLAAVAFGRSVDTSMGFTPMEGLVMATRSGSIDPGLILWVERNHGLSAADVEDVLEQKSGLAGLWGGSGDLREVMAAADSGDQDAVLAYEVYVYRIQTGIAAMCAAMDGLDALVFTGGAGEATPRLRLDVCGGLGFLGPRLNVSLNQSGEVDRLISQADATPVLVVHAREDLEIARTVRWLLQ
jgi:acetate kinase